MNTDFETCRTGFDIVDKIFLFVFALQKYSPFGGKLHGVNLRPSPSKPASVETNSVLAKQPNNNRK